MDDSGASGLLMLFAIVSTVEFWVDALSLPINIFYFITLLLNLDLTDKWIQALALGIANVGTVIAMTSIITLVFPPLGICVLIALIPFYI